MKILVDCRYVRVLRHDGISRYTVGLATALARRHPIELLVSDRRQLADLPDVPWHLAGAPTGPGEPFLARTVNRIGPDVVFSPMQTMGSWGRRYRLVLTVHDLIYYRHRTPPRDLPWPVRVLWRLYHLAWWPQRLLLDRADAVVTVSHTTAALLAGRRLTRRPVAVVPNAVDGGPGGAPVPSADRRPDLVYMGSFMPYKDVDTLARAMAELPGHRLHLMSAVPAADRARLTALAGSDRLVVHDGATDEAYREVLGSATALLCASRDEGFGIPVLEAMSLGTPVIVTDIPAFHEVAGDAAIYVPAGDSAGFAAAVRRLEDRAEHRRRSAAALARSAGFGWDRSAQVLLDLAGALHGRGTARAPDAAR